MTERFQLKRFALLATAAAVVTLGSKSSGEEPTSEEASNRQYWVHATLFSFKRGDELATYRGRGTGGGAGPNGTFGTGIANKDRQFDVSISGKLKAHRFVATVTVAPDKEDTRTRGQKTDYDLTDLRPLSLEIARDDDGRVYQLNLVPRIIEYPKPKQFEVSILRPESWSFPSSPVIVNDQDYVGQLSCAGGPVAECDIPGLAKIEFSLVHLKNATATGTLKDGVINIAHDTTTLRISNVRNGAEQQVLAGGPYQVWVRWTQPTESVEEYRKSIKELVADLKEKTKNGESLLPGSLERLEKTSESGRVQIMSFGTRQVEPDELIGSKE